MTSLISQKNLKKNFANSKVREANMNEQEVTVKSSLIEANELIKAVFSDYGIQNEEGEQISRKEFADLVGQKIWLAADILGIELD